MSDCKHGSIPSHCPHCRIAELEAELLAAELAYSNLAELIKGKPYIKALAALLKEKGDE